VPQAGKLTVLALDVDENSEVTARYGVMGFPTLILFRDGQPIKQLVGARPKASLMRELGPYLG
jgi:thioredoxin 1